LDYFEKYIETASIISEMVIIYELSILKKTPMTSRPLMRMKMDLGQETFS
jgi:hypothetical protein